MDRTRRTGRRIGQAERAGGKRDALAAMAKEIERLADGSFMDARQRALLARIEALEKAMRESNGKE